MSASVDTDDYFELMIRNAWHITGGEGAMENTSNRRVLVVHSDGAEEVRVLLFSCGVNSDTHPQTRVCVCVAMWRADGLVLGRHRRCCRWLRSRTTSASGPTMSRRCGVASLLRA